MDALLVLMVGRSHNPDCWYNKVWRSGLARWLLINNINLLWLAHVLEDPIESLPAMQASLRLYTYAFGVPSLRRQPVCFIYARAE